MSALFSADSSLGADMAEEGRLIAAENPDAATSWRHMWWPVLPERSRDSGLNQGWAAFTRLPKSNPSDLLLADFGVVPYMFHDDELEAAETWCESAEPIAINHLPGRGGAGKTRFAIELCKRMQARGWIAGFWPNDGEPTIATVQGPRLVVVDYAEHATAASLRALITGLGRTATSMLPARLLLLTRQKSGGQIIDPLNDLRADASAQLLGIVNGASENVAPAIGLTSEQRHELYSVARDRFAEAWLQEPINLTVAPDLSAHETALDVLFEAFNEVLAHESDPESPMVTAEED